MVELSEHMRLFVNNAEIKHIGTLDIIWSGETGVKVQVLRLEPKTSENILEEYRPVKPVNIMHDTIFLTVGPYGKSILDKKKDL